MAHVELIKRVFLADLANWKTFAAMEVCKTMKWVPLVH